MIKNVSTIVRALPNNKLIDGKSRAEAAKLKKSITKDFSKIDVSKMPVKNGIPKVNPEFVEQFRCALRKIYPDSGWQNLQKGDFVRRIADYLA